MTGLSGHEPHARTETSTHPLHVSAIRPLAASSCGPKDCCRTDVPGATPFRAGSEGSETPRQARPLSCAQCGDDPQAIVRAFKAGMQAAIFDTYSENLAASALRDELEQQWHAHVRRYGE